MKRLLALLCISFLVAACGAESPAPTGSVLHRGVGEEPESLDFHKARSSQAGHVQRDFGEGLVGLTPNGELRPAAAESWSISDDGKEYVFRLRPTARWSNGDPVTAEDFVFSLRRLVDPATAALYTASVSEIENAGAIFEGKMAPGALGVEALGDHELKITLERPVPYFLSLLTHPSMFPVHRGSVEQHDDRHARAGNLVSNGAYRLVDWRIGSLIELERNDYYWDNDATAIDRVIHYVTPEPMVELNRYRAGELQITRTIPPEMFRQMQEERPDEVFVSPALGVYYYGFNMTAPPFADNPKLRLALSMAVDRDMIVEIVGRGEAPAYSWVPDGVAGYDSQRVTWSELSKDERERRAKQLYQEAGYGPGNTLQTQIRYNTHETHQQIAVAIQDSWRRVLGVEATLVNEEFQVLLANLRQKDGIEIFRLNWDGDYNDAHTFLSTLETGNSSNMTGYSSEEFDGLMERAARQIDAAGRKRYMEEAERLMLQDHPLIPIYFFVTKHMVSPEVRGWGDNVLNYHYSQHLSLQEDR